MFDFAWSELALIGVVALVAIGPKDMPVAIKSIATLVKKARRMAGEFQVHVDDLMKEADLSEMRDHLKELRSLNLRGTVERAIDPDGTLRGSFTAKPALQQPGPASAEQVADFVGVRPQHTIHDPPGYVPPGMPSFAGAPFPVPPPDHLRPSLDTPPAFIPPDSVAAERALQSAPAFIPPEAAQLGLPTPEPQPIAA
jgi:sec-independent protein translocase protein TatB